MWIDISRPVAPDSLVYPGDPALRLERLSDMASGAAYNLTVATLSLHTGTHLDAPLHFAAGGAAVDDLPLARLICRAHVIELGGAGCALPEHLTGRGIGPGDAVLLKTRNGELPRDRMADRWVFVSREAARTCIDLGVGIVGLDYVDVEDPASPDGEYPIHELLLGAGVYLLEDIDLRGVAEGGYQLICLPARFAGCEAAPCRAVLGPLPRPV